MHAGYLNSHYDNADEVDHKALSKQFRVIVFADMDADILIIQVGSGKVAYTAVGFRSMFLRLMGY